MTDHPIDKSQTCQVSKRIRHLFLILGGRHHSFMPKKRDETLPPELLTLPGRLRMLREAAGFNQAELEEAAGLAQSQISQIESGTRPNPGADILIKIASKVGCNLHFLLTGKGEMWIHPPSEARRVGRR